MESGREGVIPLDKERMERLNIYFNDINLRIDLAKKIEQLQSNWNSLREYIEKERDSEIFDFIAIYNCILDKMNKLESGDK